MNKMWSAVSVGILVFVKKATVSLKKLKEATDFSIKFLFTPKSFIAIVIRILVQMDYESLGNWNNEVDLLDNDDWNVE